MATGRPLPLTERQQECIMGVCFGLRDKEIAARLYVSEHTVTGHLNRAYERLGLTHADCPRTQAALRLIHDCERATGLRLGERVREGRAP
jgi:DNA-binding NarL/FixJ family response regulator